MKKIAQKSVFLLIFSHIILHNCHANINHKILTYWKYPCPPVIKYFKEIIMRRKLKLSMLDDYVAIFNIIYICRFYDLAKEHEYIVSDIKQIEISASLLQERYEATFKKAGIDDVSFLLLKSQLVNATNTEKNRKDFSPEKLEYLNNKLKLLESRHNANYLKLKFKKAKN